MKVIEVKKKAVDEWGRKFVETRFACADENTGEILDDAQGYGYKTAQKAYAAWAWKHPDEKKQKAEKLAKKYLNGRSLEEIDSIKENIMDLDFGYQKWGMGRKERAQEICCSLGIDYESAGVSAVVVINSIIQLN